MVSDANAVVKEQTMKGYHFVSNRLRDGRPVPPDGEWLIHDGPIIMCESGLHASRYPLDALQYAPGTTLCRVILKGDLIHGKDKVVGRKRMIVARIDAEQLLWDFARWCALRVVHLWDAPDVVIRYLKIGDNSLRDAALDATQNTLNIWDARNAARAAWDAARDARDAARDTAWAALAVRAAAWSTEQKAQRQKFSRMVCDAFQRPRKDNPWTKHCAP